MEENRKECQRTASTIVFADESGIQMAPNLKRTWAPRGATPTLRQVTRSYRKISAMGSIAVSPKGRRRRIFFRLLENQNFTSETCIAFVEQLKQNIKGRICLIWDRLRSHKSKKMEAYLAKQRRVKVHYFPAYAPELNPVEYMWSYLKGSAMSNRACFDIDELFYEAKKNICFIRKDIDVVKSFVSHSPLSYVWRL